MASLNTLLSDAVKNSTKQRSRVKDANGVAVTINGMMVDDSPANLVKLAGKATDDTPVKVTFPKTEYDNGAKGTRSGQYTGAKAGNFVRLVLDATVEEKAEKENGRILNPAAK